MIYVTFRYNSGYELLKMGEFVTYLRITNRLPILPDDPFCSFKVCLGARIAEIVDRLELPDKLFFCLSRFN